MNRLTVFLMASLLVNGLLGGVLLARQLTPPAGPPPMAWSARTLDPALREQVRAHWAAQAPRLRPLRRDMREAMHRFADGLSAPSLDRPAAAAALAEVRAASAAYQSALHSGLLELLEALPPDQRRAVALRVLQHARRPEHPGRAPRRPGAPGADAPVPEA